MPKSYGTLPKKVKVKLISKYFLETLHNFVVVFPVFKESLLLKVYFTDNNDLNLVNFVRIMITIFYKLYVWCG